MAGGFAEFNEDRESKLAAIHYKVPRRILRAHLDENEHSKSLRRRTILLPEQEQELSTRIIRPAEIWYPITLQILRMCVFTHWKKNNIPNPFVK
jgi:hypothetical protein